MDRTALVVMRSVAGLVGLAVVVGCAGLDSEAAQYERLGLRRVGDDTISVRYVFCEDEQLRSVTLHRIDGDDPVGVDGDAVVATAGPGSTPGLGDGSLRFELPDAGARYSLDVVTPRLTASSGEFGLDDLDAERYLVFRHLLDEDDFLVRAAAAC